MLPLVKAVFAVLMFSFLCSVFACSGDPLLTNLRTNNLTVIIKGTYESNNPKDWSWPMGADFSSKVIDDSVNMYPTTISSAPSTFMIDITGMNLYDGSKTSKFGHKRKTYQCSATDESGDFFNGGGIKMENDDVDSGREYTSLRLYLRKLLFSDAKKYELSNYGWEESSFRTYFKEKRIDAFNFNLLLVNYFYDTLRYENDGEDENRIYPLKIDITNGLVFDADEEMVLEVRLVIKNFVKLYEYNRLDYTSSQPYLAHYFGVSDWLRDVKADENTIGGNLLAVARTYVKGRTGTVRGSISGAKYIIGIPAGSDISDYTLPNSALRDLVSQATIPAELIEGTDTIPAILIYHMQYEKYWSDWKKFVDGVQTACGGPSATQDEMQAYYEDKWMQYNDTANNFKIPPLATYTSNGSFEITNIAPGTYDFYSSSSVPAWGTLFKDGDFQPIVGGMGVTINEGDDLTL